MFLLWEENLTKRSFVKGSSEIFAEAGAVLFFRNFVSEIQNAKCCLTQKFQDGPTRGVLLLFIIVRFWRFSQTLFYIAGAAK